MIVTFTTRSGNECILKFEFSATKAAVTVGFTSTPNDDDVAQVKALADVIIAHMMGDTNESTPLRGSRKEMRAATEEFLGKTN